MYNRYVPSEDGSFRRQSLPDGPPPPKPGPPPPSANLPAAERKVDQGLGSFFGSLLPKDLETEDLIVVLLLLLISADCKDTPNTALITMLIYLFL